MAVNTSAEKIRETKEKIQEMIAKMESARDAVNQSVAGATQAWTDSKGDEYRAIMKKVTDSMEPSIEQLRITLPKLEELASHIDRYNSINFK